MQIFHRSTNTIAQGEHLWLDLLSGDLRVRLLGAAALVVRDGGRGVVKKQPVPFSHQHHVAGLGIDCRYCHTSVERSAFAGIPPTETCMNCHRQIWTNAELLEPIRASYRDNIPVQWTRINDLPDFVYFNHSVHIAKGMGCATCHGPVNKMQLTFQHASLQMEWCISCHRNPGAERAAARRGVQYRLAAAGGLRSGAGAPGEAGQAVQRQIPYELLHLPPLEIWFREMSESDG